MSLDYFRSHYPSPVEGVFEAFFGLAFHLVLFHTCEIILNQAFSTLNRYDRLEISNKFVSSTFAIITCSLAIKGKKTALVVYLK